ncbi:hypothetical protein RJZ56_005217 [Blastomyces dermatitidis]
MTNSQHRPGGLVGKIRALIESFVLWQKNDPRENEQKGHVHRIQSSNVQEHQLHHSQEIWIDDRCDGSPHDYGNDCEANRNDGRDVDYGSDDVGNGTSRAASS